MAKKLDPVGIGCLWVVAIGALLLTIGKCAPTPKTSHNFGSASLENQIASIDAPPTIEPLSATSLELGIQHLGTVLDAEGISGAMIYSQNCYDGIARDFSWKTLDRCGAFDLLAVRTAEASDMAGLDSEVEYFDPEAAAGRYLAVAIRAGEEASQADARLEEVKRKTGVTKLP